MGVHKHTFISLKKIQPPKILLLSFSAMQSSTESYSSNNKISVELKEVILCWQKSQFLIYLLNSIFSSK